MFWLWISNIQVIVLINYFLMFLKEVSSAHQGCIYLIKNTVKTPILWNIIKIKNNHFLL